MKFPDFFNFWFARLVLLAAVSLGLATSAKSAHAEPVSDFKTVTTFAGYGALGGTALGLASFPFTGSTRGIFMGTSIGIFLGVTVGVYHVMNRDNPENPFNQGGALREEGATTAPDTPYAGDREPPLVQANFAVLSF